MPSMLFVVLYLAFRVVFVVAQSSNSVVCVAGQCLQGLSNTTIGIKLSAASGSSNVLLLPGQYTSSLGPELLHSLLTSSSSTLTPAPGFGNATLSTLPLNVALQPGLSVYSGALYSGQSAFSPLPSAPIGNTSINLPGNSLAIATNVWAAVSVGGSSGQRIILWEGVPDVSQLPSGGASSLALLDMQSASCSPACSGSGVCSANGTCVCPAGFAGSACETCAEGFFGATCQPCPTGCTNCDQGIAGSGRCLSPVVPNAPSTCNCINGECGSDGQCACLAGWTTAANGTACAQCASGFFLSTTGACQVCELGCSECADSTAQCTTCKTGFTLDPTDKTKCDALPQTATGGVPCPDRSFSSNGVCTLCSSSCQTCTGPSSNDCVICAAGQYSFNGSCVSANTDGVCEGTNGLIADNNKHECDVCGASCTSCKYPNFSAASIISQLQCTGCLPGFVLSNGTCLAQCPTGTFVSPQDNLTCVACSSSCGSCVGSADFCLTCPTGQLAASGKCVSSCPSNTFTSGGQCVNCHPDCATCSGPSFNQCSTCSPGLPVLTSGRCLPTCTKTQFFDTSSNTCQACDTTCSSCSGAGPSKCLACASSTSVLRSGACVQANCANSTNVIPGLGVCLSELVATPTGAAAEPSISGVADPIAPVVTKGRGLLWWEILLMALGCAFIFLVVIWLFRRRARKQRAKRTAQFASKKNLNGPQGWRGRLIRFGERLFGHGPSKRAQKTPGNAILPVAYKTYDGTWSRPTSSVHSLRDIKLKSVPAKNDAKPKKSSDDDIDMFIDSYNHSAYTRESRAPSTLPGLEDRRRFQRANQRHVERESIYSQVTGVQRHTPEPRQPVRRAASAASRLSASSIGSEMTHHAPAKEGVLIDIDNDDAPRLPPLPLQMLGTGSTGSAGYGLGLGPTTEAQRYAQQHTLAERPAVLGVAQPVMGTIGTTATGASFMPIPVTLTGGGGMQGQYWLTPVAPQGTAASQPLPLREPYPVPTYAASAHDEVVIQPINTGGSYSRNPFRKVMY